MSRIIKTIEIEGNSAVALFDTGALYTYMRSSLAQDAPRIKMPSPPIVAIGGRTLAIREICLIKGKIEGLDFVTDAVPIDELGKADLPTAPNLSAYGHAQAGAAQAGGYDLDILIGARTMEQWEIKLDPKTGTLDLDGLRRREFTEFCNLHFTF